MEYILTFFMSAFAVALLFWAMARVLDNKSWVQFVIVAIVCLLIYAGIKTDIMPEITIPEQISGKVSQTQKSTAIAKATPIVVSADELISALNDNALNASNTYKNRYVEVTGKLSNIDSSGDYFSLEPFYEDSFLDTVMCKIAKEHLNAVSNLTIGQQVTVIGTITDVGEVIGYSLKVETIK